MKTILYLADLLEMCQFKVSQYLNSNILAAYFKKSHFPFQVFWQQIHEQADLIKSVAGFEDSVRRFVCHVICITYQTIEERVLGELLGLVQESSVHYWLDQYGWKVNGDGYVTVSNQEEIIKTRNITEKIDIESVASIMASCY